jgi:hypothetical protein
VVVSFQVGAAVSAFAAGATWIILSGGLIGSARDAISQGQELRLMDVVD